MDEQTALLHLVAERLAALSVPYMLSGSVALNVYAEPRMTRDIDVVIDLRSEDVDAFVDAFQTDCYVDRETVRGAVRHRDMFNIIHEEWVLKVDFVVHKDTEYRREELARRRNIDLAGKVVAVVTPEDLLLSKLVWGEGVSELQRRDAEKLVGHVTGLDWAYLERWALELGVADDLARVRRGQ